MYMKGSEVILIYNDDILDNSLSFIIFEGSIGWWGAYLKNWYFKMYTKLHIGFNNLGCNLKIE